MSDKKQHPVLDYLAYLALRIVVCIIEATPVDTCQSICRMLAVLAHRILGIRSDVIEDNLLHAFPEKTARQRDELAFQMWEHFFLFLIEVVHAPRKIHENNWRDYITLVEARQIILSLFDDRPVLIVCGHYGNFELSGVLLGLLGFPTYTIARPLDNPYLDRFVNDFRGLRGQYIISKSGSAGQVEEILARGGTIALLGDQYAGPRGYWVNFFGRPASSHKAIGLLAMSAEALVMFCFSRRQGKPLHHQMGMTEVLDFREQPEMKSLDAITRWYTGQLEDTIRREPRQYWWLHRRWKDPRVPKQPAAKRQAA